MNDNVTASERGKSRPISKPESNSDESHNQNSGGEERREVAWKEMWARLHIVDKPHNRQGSGAQMRRR